MALVLSLVHGTSAFLLINIDGPPPACKEAAPLPQIEMNSAEILILTFCAVVGWLAMGYSFAETALLLLASGTVLTVLWLAFVLVSA